MNEIQDFVDLLRSLPTEYYIIIILAIVGFIGLLAGASISNHAGIINTQIKARQKRNTEKLSRILDVLTNLPILKKIKNSVKKSISYNIMEDYRLNIRANIITIVLVVVSILLIVFMWGIGQLWYVKLLLVALSIFFPFYILTFILDIIKGNIQKQVPLLIDEFTSAFVSTPKVKDAMLVTSKKIDKKLGNILGNIADSPYIEDGLALLKERLDNTWLNIFVTIIINHKTSGGDLVEQLYRLKSTVARYNKIQKKKDKRLVVYEIFAVLAAIFSVPLVFYVNTALLGTEITLVDAQSNVMISNIILSSMFALVVIRMLRRM